VLLSGPLGPVGPLAGLVNDSGIGSTFNSNETRTISADGTKVVFASSADGMDPATDDDRFGGVYVRDLTTNTTTLVSRATGAAGAIGNGGFGAVTISADGTRVAFTSTSTNLDPADTDPKFSVYVRDLTTSTTYLASRANGVAGQSANADAWQPSLSSDGRYVAFTSGATNLSGSTPTLSVYRRDLTTGATAVVSTQIDGTTRVDGQAPSISPNGAQVAFLSNTAIDTVNDTNLQQDVYLDTVGTTTVTLISRANGAAGAVGSSSSSEPSMTTVAGDAKVAFLSNSTNLTATADSNGAADAFVRDVNAGTTTLVSRADLAGGALENQGSNAVSITRDGTGVAFASTATNLGATTDGNTAEVYLRSGSSTTLVSRAAGAGGAPSDGTAFFPAADQTGTAIAFVARATNLSTANDHDFSAVFVRRSSENTTTFASRPTGTTDFIGGINQSSTPIGGRMVSADGRYVIFGSQSDSLSGEDDNRFTNVYRYDVKTGDRVLVSRATGATGVAANGNTFPLGISADGNRLLFLGTNATDLDPDTPSGSFVLYLRDVAAGTTTIAGRRPGVLGAALGDTSTGSLSGDGHHVAFITGATIDAADTNATGDVYVRNLDTGSDTLASRADGADGAVEDKFAEAPSLDFDGNRVAWDTTSTNLPGFDNTKFRFTYVRDLASGTTTLVGRADGPGGATVDSSAPSISDDGNRVAFGSADTNVTPVATDNRQHIYVRDVAANQTILASRADGTDGAADNPPAGATTFGNAHSLSGDGNRVMFLSNDPNLVAGDINGSVDMFVRDLSAGRTFAVGRADGVDGALGSFGSGSGGLNRTGNCAAFTAKGSGFVANGVPGADFTQIYLRAIDAPCPPDDVVPPTVNPGPTPNAAPVLSLFKLSPSVFRVGPRATAISAARRKLPIGTTLRYKANEAVTMTFTFARRAAGRRKGSKCVAPRKSLRKHKACTRLVVVGKLTRKSASGSGSLKFSGRIGRRALKPGRYQATAQAKDSGGLKSRQRTARFTVKR
jgi:WD40-like Beta Propeller Repeat